MCDQWVIAPRHYGIAGFAAHNFWDLSNGSAAACRRDSRPGNGQSGDCASRRKHRRFPEGVRGNASEVVYVAAPGALVPDWSLLPYTKADKTQWPFVANPHA